MQKNRMSIRIFRKKTFLKNPVLKKKNSAVPIAAHRSTRAIPNANTAAPDYEKTKKHPQGCFFNAQCIVQSAE